MDQHAKLSTEQKLKQKWESLRIFIKNSDSLATTNTKNYSLSNNNCSFCDDINEVNLSAKKGLVSVEEGFGTFLIICGLIAAVANALILVAVSRKKRYKSSLFMIITNFAIIDLFKAFCAIYMGSVLVSVYNDRHTNSSASKSDQYFMVFKMLQTSVFMMYIGNLCSVFNLILATCHEFFYIKMPLLYRKYVTASKVTCAIMVTWVLGLVFGLAKALHGGGGFSGSSSVLVQISDRNYTATEKSLGFNGTVLNTPSFLDEVKKKNNNWSSTVRPIFRRNASTQPADIYTLILLSALLVCLIIVGVVYINLYLTIRRSETFRRDMDKLNNTQSRSRRKNPRGNRRPAMKLNDQSPTTDGSRDSTLTPAQLRITGANGNCNQLSSPLGNARDSGKSTMRDTAPQILSRNKFGSRRLLGRYKCVVIILTVCAVNFVYLSVYSALQLLHMIHINIGVSGSVLRQRYVTNFVLRALFVLHAALNPLIFFRIRQFRSSFIGLFRCRKPPEQRNRTSRFESRKMSRFDGQLSSFYSGAPSCGTGDLSNAGRCLRTEPKKPYLLLKTNMDISEAAIFV